jgi:hypothetical protein
MLFNNAEPKSLAEWLDIATKGIASAGTERITREIKVHFAEAVEAHVANGEPEPVAQANALRQLGNAKLARRSFRKRHLTEGEEKSVLKLQNSANSMLWLAFKVLAGLYIIHALKEIYPKCALLFSVLIFGCMASAMFSFWMLRQSAIKSKFSLLLLIESVQATLMALAFALLACSGDAYGPVWALILYFIAYDIRYIRMWKKIRRTENPTIGNSGFA